MTGIVELRPGVRIWFDGTWWEVVALHGCEVSLRSGQSLQRIAVTELAARGVSIVGEDDTVDPAAVVLSSLTASQRRELDVRAGHVRSVLAAANEDRTDLESVLAAKAGELRAETRWNRSPIVWLPLPGSLRLRRTIVGAPRQ